MGFGLCALGYMCLMLEHVGLDFLGYVLICRGFYGVFAELKDYRGYRVAYIASAVALPFSLFNLYSLLTGYTSLPELPGAAVAVKGVVLSVAAVVCAFAHGNSTASIARDGGASFFSLRAKATGYLTALYMALKIGASFSGADGSLAAVIVLGQFVVLFLNGWLCFTCFTTITTKSRARQEAELIKQESEEIIRKKRFRDEEKEDDR